MGWIGIPPGEFQEESFVPMRVEPGKGLGGSAALERLDLAAPARHSGKIRSPSRGIRSVSPAVAVVAAAVAGEARVVATARIALSGHRQAVADDKDAVRPEAQGAD